MYLRYAIAVLAHRFVLVILLSVIGLAGGFGWYKERQAYTTSAHLLYDVSETLAPLRAPAPERFVKTASQQILSDDVLAVVASAQGDGSTVDDIRRATTVSGGTDSDVVEVSMSAETPEQSRRRIDALGDSGSIAPSGVTVSHLWTGATTAMVSPLVVLMGAAAGALAGAFLLLAWAAARRPLLSATTAEIPGVAVYPDLLPVSSSAARAEEVMAWVDLRARGQEHRVLVVNLDSSAKDSTDFGDALRRVSRTGLHVTTPDAPLKGQEPTGTTTALFVASVPGSTEHEIQRRAQALAGSVDGTALVLLAKRK